ncbi:OmpA family protein [Pedobacter sp. SYP-B3415]|uniref:OmpA family protein n=1 Tax=Pedobacter sp. SYP-B3415 TaxID=2496641 RepID=UPI0013EA966F|nr:OmpA family protein [Pedobacter sp. SYP-B3415]
MAVHEHKPKTPKNWYLALGAIIVVLILVAVFATGKSDHSTEHHGAASDSSTIESEINANWSGVDPKPDASLHASDSSSINSDNLQQYSIDETVAFKPGTATLDADAQSKLRSLASTFTKSFPESSLDIAGVSNNEAGNKLADERAKAVRDFIAKNGRIPSSQLKLVQTEAPGKQQTTTGNEIGVHISARKK